MWTSCGHCSQFMRQDARFRQSVPSSRHSKHTFKPQAVASDVTTDDTAEARRRLARQFRRHKLEPKLTEAAPLTIQGLHPRPRQPPLQQDDPQQPPAARPASADALFDPVTGHLPAAPQPTAAVARQLLERQFLLGLSSSSSSSSSSYAYDGFSMYSSDSSTSSSGSDSDGENMLEAPAGLLLGTPESTGKQLTQAIKRTSDWRQVMSLLQEYAPELNTRHLCASITHLVHLQASFAASHSATSAAATAVSNQRKHHKHRRREHHQFREEQQQQLYEQHEVDPEATAFLQQLMASISGVLPSLEYRQACNVLWAVSKLQHAAQPNKEWLAGLYHHAMVAGNSSRADDVSAAADKQQQSPHLLPDMMHAAQLASALVKLQHVLEPQHAQQFADWVTSTTQELLQQVCQQYEQVPTQHQHQEHSHSSYLQAHACVESRDLATLAWALASLGVQPGPAWLSAFAGAIACKGLVAPGSPRDLSMMLWATATFSKSAAEGSAAANALQTAAAAVLQGMKDSDLRGWDAQSVSNTLWALATLGQRPPVPWLNQLLRRVESLAVKQHMNPQAVSASLWALAALGVVPPASCMTALLSAATRQLQQFTPQGLSNTIWALAVLEQAAPKAWQTGFWPVSRAALPAMTSQGLVNCLWAAARLGLQPPQEWVVDVAQLLLDQGVQKLSSQGLSNVLWAMARINCNGRQSQELLSVSLQQAVLLLDSQQAESVGTPAAHSSSPFSIYELAALMYTVSQLRARESSLLLQQQQQQLHSQQVQPSVWPAGSNSRSASPARPGSPRSAQQQTADFSASPASSNSGAGAAEQPADLLSTLTSLLQTASLSLLPSAGPSELAILFYSQVSTSMSLQVLGHTGLCIPRPWVDAWLAATQSCFGSASSRDLAQWLYCMAQRGVRPPGQWLAGFQVATFRQMSKANSQDLANMLWALGSLGVNPDPAWLQQHLQEASRRQYQKQLTPQHLANIAWALAKLGHRPDRDWLVRFQEDVFSALPSFKPQELTSVLWALAVLNCKVEQGLVDECLAVMYEHLSSYKANEVALTLWAVARLRGQPQPELMAAALQHCFSQARQLSPKGLSMLMWSVGNSATPPPKAWVAKLLIATQVRMSGFSAQDLSMLAVSLARLEYRPPDTWLDCFAAAAAAQMRNFEAQALANTLWALATLHYTPPEEWMAGFDDQLQRQLASFTPAHVAMTMWAMSSLQWLPQQPLWQQLQERAELHSASFCVRSRRMLSRAIRVLEKIEDEGTDDV